MFNTLLIKTKNLKDMASQKINAKMLQTSMAVSGALATVGLAECTTINPNTSANNFLKILFNVIMFGGIVMIVAGVAMLISTISAITSGEQAQPGQIGKAIGFLLGGIVCVGLKAIIKSITGVDPTTMTFF